jgi:chorismate dehydratase
MSEPVRGRHLLKFLVLERMRKLHISAISFLNTAPLMWDFEKADAARDFEISYTIPSKCAEALRDGSSDIGIIPVAAYTTIPNLVVLPDVAIAAKRAVRSILLVSKMPLDQIRTVAADTSSRTSVALLKVLFRKWLHGDRRMKPMPPVLDSMLAECDAALVIGDRALQVDRSKYVTFDLAEEWIRRTGKPFVFAFWAVRMAALNDMRPGLELDRVFRESRDHGLELNHIRQLAREWAPRVGITESDVITYLTENVSYVLDSENMEGLSLFYRYAQECGALPEAPPLRFIGDFQSSIAGLRGAANKCAAEP